MDRHAEIAAVHKLQETVVDKHRPLIAAVIKAGMDQVAERVATMSRPDLPVEFPRHVSDALEAMYRDIIGGVSQRILDAHKSGFAFLETKADESEFHNRLYEEFFRTYGLNRVTQITETTRVQIISIIETGLKEGMSVDEIAASIQEVAAILSDTRAEIISRTETHSAAMYSSTRSAAQSTVPLNKEWVVNDDQRTRDFGEGDGVVDMFSHRLMDGVTLPLDQPYQVPTRVGGTEPLMFPGDPEGSAANVIRCRCGQVYVEAD